MYLRKPATEAHLPLTRTFRGVVRTWPSEEEEEAHSSKKSNRGREFQGGFAAIKTCNFTIGVDLEYAPRAKENHGARFVGLMTASLHQLHASCTHAHTHQKQDRRKKQQANTTQTHTHTDHPRSWEGCWKWRMPKAWIGDCCSPRCEVPGEQSLARPESGSLTLGESLWTQNSENPTLKRERKNTN